MYYWALFLAVHILGTIFRGVGAQTSEAVCPASYNWADNSLGQSPCVVAAYLLKQCSNTEIDIPVLPPGDHYNPGDNSVCNCNTVVYSLVSACADCQGGIFDTWLSWSTSCANIYASTFPVSIPSGTAVPGWAYLNVVASGTYSATKAMQDLSAPESTPLGFPTSGSSASLPSYVSTSFTSTSPTSTSSSSKSSNVAAIAGGVVAGVITIALIAILIAWLVIQRRRAAAAAAEAQADKITPMEYTPPNALGGAFPPHPQPQTPTPPVYNPSDPSTYPEVAYSNVGGDYPHASYIPTPSMGYPQSPPSNYTSSPPPMGITPSPPPTNPAYYYTGAPEI